MEAYENKYSGSCISDDVIAANGTKTTGAQTPPENRLSSAIIYILFSDAKGYLRPPFTFIL